MKQLINPFQKIVETVALMFLIFAIGVVSLPREVPGKVTVVLSPGYVASWTADLDNDSISFELVAPTTGWVGFGLSHSGGMANSDIIIGGVGENGEPYFKDRHGIGTVEPSIDKSQDWILEDASENGTHTFLKFWRKLETCDEEDITIGEDTSKLIWSFGSNDDIKYHGALNRGSQHVNFLDPPMPEPDISQLQKWIVQANDTMPSDPTSYWCTVHKRPEMSSVQHVVGFDTRFDTPEAKQHTHHFIFRKCIAPRGESPEDLFEPHVGQPGQDCKARPKLTASCGTYMFVWAIGGRRTMFPDHVGHPIAENGENEYFMLELHYDNPSQVNGSKFPTGLEIYYTDQLRPNEAGIMTFGHVVYWAQTLPPNSPSFTVYGHCSSLCTKAFPKEGLNVFNILLHSHMSGRKLKLQHFRNNQELPWFAYDDFYDFNYQQNRPLRQEKKILPGDSLVMNCVCDTTWKNDSTVVIGDLGITDEMCEAFVWYYPRIRIDTCMSTYNPVNILSDFGLQQLGSAGAGEMDPVIRRPLHLNGTRYTTYLNKIFNWTEEFRQHYQNRLKSSYHLQVCASLANYTFFPRGEFVKFPTHIVPYAPDQVCERDGFYTTEASNSKGNNDAKIQLMNSFGFILSCLYAYVLQIHRL